MLRIDRIIDRILFYIPGKDRAYIQDPLASSIIVHLHKWVINIGSCTQRRGDLQDPRAMTLQQPCRRGQGSECSETRTAFGKVISSDSDLLSTQQSGRG